MKGAYILIAIGALALVASLALLASSLYEYFTQQNKPLPLDLIGQIVKFLRTQVVISIVVAILGLIGGGYAIYAGFQGRKISASASASA